MGKKTTFTTYFYQNFSFTKRKQENGGKQIKWEGQPILEASADRIKEVNPLARSQDGADSRSEGVLVRALQRRQRREGRGSPEEIETYPA